MTCVQTQTFNESTCVTPPRLSQVVSAPTVHHSVLVPVGSHLAFTGADLRTIIVLGVGLVLVGLVLTTWRRFR